jgi:fructokinase
VAITRGGSGCLVASAASRLTLPSLPVDVVDTIGAGDAFMSGLLFAILSQDLDGTIREGTIAESDLVTIAETALRSARVTVSRAGANPPTLAELRA